MQAPTGRREYLYPRARSVLLCVLTPWLSSMAQPDPRLHSLGGRWLSDAAFESTFNGCQAGACGCSMAEHRSSRRPPAVLHRGCAGAWEGPCSRFGRRVVGEPAAPRLLVGPPGPSTELRGLWSPLGAL